MALFLVERDLSDIPPERLRREQRGVASACLQLKAQGKRIRYINSAVVPADGRSLDLFGADDAELIKAAHASAGVLYSRIVQVLDLTPSFVHRDTSQPRRPRHLGAGADTRKGTTGTMTADSAPELARWLADGQRLFGVCLETLETFEQMRARTSTLESENELLREELARLRQKMDVLQTDRADMVAAFNDLAGHVTQVVDHILQKSEDGENAK